MWGGRILIPLRYYISSLCYWLLYCGRAEEETENVDDRMLFVVGGKVDTADGLLMKLCTFF